MEDHQGVSRGEGPCGIASGHGPKKRPRPHSTHFDSRKSGNSTEFGEKKRMNQIGSLFMFSCGDYEKVKKDVWEENWKAMRLYSVVALVAFGVITLVSVFSLSIGKFKWVYLVYTFLSLVYFCISRCQLRSFLGKNWLYTAFLPRCCCSALLRER